jgi:hypothetical protein
MTDNQRTEDKYVAGLRREIAGHEEAFKRTGCASAEMARDMCQWELDQYLAIDSKGEQPVMH